MKKLIIYTCLLLSASSAFAQKDAKAKVILDQVSKKYRSYNTIKSDFTFTIDNQQEGVKQTQNGTLITQSKTNKFKITLYSGAAKTDVAQEIISNGKSQWTYLKRENEVQIADAGSGGDSFNPAQLFTMYEKGYKYLYTGDQKIAGKLYNVIELTPEDDQKQFFKIRLSVDKTSKQIYNALIFDKNGAKYNYTLRSFITSTTVSDAAFTFDIKAHPGVEVLNLR